MDAFTQAPVVIPDAAPILSATPASLYSAFNYDNQRYASVACDAEGDFVITWTDYRTLSNKTQQQDVYVRKFDAMGGLLGVDAGGNPVYDTRTDVNGNPIAGTAPTMVNAYTAGNQKWSTVAMDLRGDFVVTWSSFGQDAAGGYGIYAQQFDTTGVAVGTPFQVNTTTQGNQELSTVAMDSQGNFVIAWSNDPTPTKPNTDIVVRTFSANGAALLRARSWWARRRRAISTPTWPRIWPATASSSCGRARPDRTPAATASTQRSSTGRTDAWGG